MLVGTATLTPGNIPVWDVVDKTLDPGGTKISDLVPVIRQISFTVGTALQTATFSADVSFTVTPGTDGVGNVLTGTAATTGNMLPVWTTADKTIGPGTVYESAIVTVTRQISITQGTATETHSLSADCTFTIYGDVIIGTAATTANVLPSWSGTAKTLNSGTVYESAVVTIARTFSTTSPLTGGGSLSADRTLAISNLLGYSYIPIEWALDGASPPDTVATITSSSRTARVRTFDSASTEDVEFDWIVPQNAVAASTVRYLVHFYVTAATGPSNEGVAFGLAGASIGDGDPLGVTLGAEVVLTKTGMTENQYDIVITGWSGAVTITNLAAGEVAKMKFRRIHDNAADTYAQLIGVSGIVIEYSFALGAV